MDPLTQGVLGATAPLALTKNKSQQLIYVLIIGFLSGMAADLDIFIRSNEDPLLFLQFHRHFTHSLFFIPFGALICASGFYYLFKKKLTFKLIYIYSFLGYATHGLLDACTSYGTQLLWPLSHERFAWNIISIIDPLFTAPLILLISLHFFKKTQKYSQLALLYAFFYLFIGYVQKQRVIKVAQNFAKHHQHQISQLMVKPSFGNIILWRAIYQNNFEFHTLAIRVTNNSITFPGETIKKFTSTQELNPPPGALQTIDIERFRWFSSDYLSQDPGDPLMIYDIRYSILPNKIAPLWGIRLDPKKQNKHVEYIQNSPVTENILKDFTKMLFYKEPIL